MLKLIIKILTDISFALVRNVIKNIKKVVIIQFKYFSIKVTCYLKSNSHFLKSCFCLLQWKPFINDKKWFMLKVRFVVNISKFLFMLFWNWRKRFHKKANVNFKRMTPQTGKQMIATHILSNISRSKDNQKMKFG